MGFVDLSLTSSLFHGLLARGSGKGGDRQGVSTEVGMLPTEKLVVLALGCQGPVTGTCSSRAWGEWSQGCLHSTWYMDVSPSNHFFFYSLLQACIELLPCTRHSAKKP